MMKATGIVRDVDPLGRIVIPKELRKTFGIMDGDPLEIFVDSGMIILKPYEPACIFCGQADGNVKEYKGKLICGRCAKEIGGAE